MDIAEQEAERIFKFIIKKLGYEDAYIEQNDRMYLIGIKKNLTCHEIWFVNDISIGIIKGYSWTDMLKNVIQRSNEAKSYCYIYAESVHNKFNMPKTLDELRIMVDLEN